MTASARFASALKLAAGELCLDFANTAEWHASESPQERLKDYGSLVSWSREVGVLDDAGERRIRREAATHPAQAVKAWKQAIAVREMLYRVFVALIHGRPIDASDLERLNQTNSDALRHLRMEHEGDGLEWRWAGSPQDLRQMLWPIVHSAADLLTSDRRARLGQCADDRGCGWLFLDTSKNRSRRWCDMGDCGNRAKARRHYQRSRQREAGA